MKRCPECGSTHVSPVVFYRPSIWKCEDCGYEGAFIVEIVRVDGVRHDDHPTMIGSAASVERFDTDDNDYIARRRSQAASLAEEKERSGNEEQTTYQPRNQS